MTSSRQFDAYLQGFVRRLQQLQTARGAAAVAACALVVSLAAVTVAIRKGFPDDLMVAARVVLLASLLATGYYFFAGSRRSVDRDAAKTIESRTPAFGGRVEAYLDTADSGNPMRELLAEQTLKIAARHPPERRVRVGEFRAAWSAAAVSAAALLLIAVLGPGNYAFGLRDLWVGWAFPGLLPPQSIEVTPGDAGIRLGGTVTIRAATQGFRPADAYVHARFGDDEWQQVPMVPADQGFEFTFFSVRQPLQYYVSATNVRSPTFDIEVVDLPVVENLALSLRYPEWTGRAEEVRDPGGDVRAIAETEVTVRITADRAMTPGVLMVNDRAVPLDVDGQSASARFEVSTDGQYHVSATVGGERIRLTDDYFVTVLEDVTPEISFARPGRDWSASRVEEVTASIVAEDDYRVDSVRLHYAVNGGGWQTVELGAPADAVEVDHVFFLESLAESATPLEPGDLIAYYAVAEDRNGSTRTDMFFVDVQPFDRRYSQSQQAGGAMANQQGGRQDEISQRQREIIISTWNLIREQHEEGRGDDAYVSDNAALLARLQQTLKGQVETLARRTEARQLTATDEQIARFVESLRHAAEAMQPAADNLAELDLEQALLPEQEALQHLLAAEAVFTDINVSLQANNRGGGGQAGRDLAEMFELEMDLEKNQYETGSVAMPEAPPQQMQEAADELAELARRQERLARNQRRNPLSTPEQRWQQEMLRREVEQLQRRLEELARQSGQAGAEDQQGAASGQAQTGGNAGQREIDELRRRLDSATRAMTEADEAMRASQDPESLQRAMDEARRQLEGARDTAAEARQRSLQAAVDDLAERAQDLHGTQADLDKVLQDAVREFLAGEENDDRLGTGLSWQEEERLADEKRRLLAALQELQQDIQLTARDLDATDPGAADGLRDSVVELQELEVEARLAVAAAYIEQGEAVYVASSESAVTEALRQLRDDLRRVGGSLGGAGGDRAGWDDRLARALGDTRQLRRDLQQGLPDSGAQLGQRARELSQDVRALLRQLAQQGVPPRDLDALRELAAGISAADFSGNEAVLASEARAALTLVEQLELALAKSARGDEGLIRNNAGESIPADHREIVADYYRRLGRTEAPD